MLITYKLKQNCSENSKLSRIINNLFKIEKIAN